MPFAINNQERMELPDGAFCIVTIHNDEEMGVRETWRSWVKRQGRELGQLCGRLVCCLETGAGRYHVYLYPPLARDCVELAPASKFNYVQGQCLRIGHVAIRPEKTAVSMQSSLRVALHPLILRALRTIVPSNTPVPSCRHQATYRARCDDLSCLTAFRDHPFLADCH
ncbi:hypothetical protein EJ05DRAFT_482781 [Pseudovirgaria hyperparasitica]|uniref:Uncharacterized protein n=1 Tax=Pseudovirgaria hyperparasitica TaxID=470096 RepID=A0A6A6WIA9_9PEZI|nr:uncharacterized protein EJ05DRAFT_482781 [Pseudovirgaria hyperparasitica]KAF2761979.1 hypothetical protein EJ05DRAFT_482781 [Pseudovirgaria hyperparasitica]